MRRVVVVALAAACGRLGFEVSAGGDAASDVAGDAEGPPPKLVQVIAPGFGSAASVASTISETSGNLLVAAVYWDQSPDTVTLADSAGLAWTSLPAQGIPSVCGGTTGNATGAQVYYATIAATGTNKVTVTQTSGVQPLGVFLLEYGNVGAVDVSSGGIAPGSTKTMTAPVLTTTATELVIAFFNDTIGAGVIAPGTGYTVEARDTAFPNMVEDAVVPAGTHAPDAMLPSTGDACWVVTAVAFRGR